MEHSVRLDVVKIYGFLDSWVILLLITNGSDKFDHKRLKLLYLCMLIHVFMC